jgi:hypothetical protein
MVSAWMVLDRSRRHVAPSSSILIQLYSSCVYFIFLWFSTFNRPQDCLSIRSIIRVTSWFKFPIDGGGWYSGPQTIERLHLSDSSEMEGAAFTNPCGVRKCLKNVWKIHCNLRRTQSQTSRTRATNVSWPIRWFSTFNPTGLSISPAVIRPTK